VPVEIAISDFPTQLEPLIAAGTRGARSLGVGVRQSEFPPTKKSLQWKSRSRDTR
jgi:hypothetical protein